MAEIPTGDYSHLHRSIDQLRSMNERGMFGPLTTTDLRTSLVHDYKPINVSDLRNNNININVNDRLDYLTAKTIIDGRAGSANDGNSNPDQLDLRHEQPDQKPYVTNNNNNSAPSTPPTPLSISEAQMQETKIFGVKEAQLHNQLHMREAKPYKCSQCAKAFANSSYLSQHTRIHLGIKPYRCEICQRKFTQLSHLQQHIRTHTGDKPYKCRHPGCTKAFSQLSNLQSHSRCHQTDKPYKCNSCYKCFMDETSLLEHIPKHKESKHLKTHICQFCGKSYTQETYLSKHLQKHAERAEKQQRPPALGLTNLNLPRNLSINNSAPPSSLSNSVEHPYWPKVSPDSAASLAEAMQQNQYDFSMAAAASGAAGNPNHGDPLQLHRSALIDHHRALNGAGTPEDVEDLVITGRQSNLSAQQHQQQQQQHLSQQQQQQQQHQTSSSSASSGSNNNNNGENNNPSNNPTSYDIKTSSAFTPINVSMSPHLNSLAHHHHHHHHPQLPQRPSYLYDTISFGQNVKNMTNHQHGGAPGSGPTAFPNQLISLHQIRSYTHQASVAAGGLMAGEHLLGIGVGGVGKDKSS